MMDIESLPEDTIVFSEPSYNNSIIGVTWDGRAVYDFHCMVRELMQNENMTEDEAEDFLNFNVLGSIGSPDSPIVVFTDQK